MKEEMNEEEMKLLINTQTSTVAPFKFGNVQVISSHT